MSSLKLSVYTIKKIDGINWDYLIEQLLNRNSEQERCVINEQSDSYIGGVYLLETVYNQTQYNMDNNCFEPVQIRRFNALQFDLFTETGSLLLWGGKRVASSFLTAIEISSNHQIVFDYKDTDFKKAVSYLLKIMETTFTRMRLTGIVIDQGIIANCSVSLKEQDNPQELVKKYLDRISQISVSIGQNEQAVSMTLYSSGAVVVYKDRDEMTDEAMNIISEMFGGVI